MELLDIAGSDVEALACNLGNQTLVERRTDCSEIAVLGDTSDRNSADPNHLLNILGSRFDPQFVHIHRAHKSSSISAWFSQQ